jgi:hypothetical protein
MSDRSDSFVENLKSSLPFMSLESETFYKRKLSGWKLSAKQWETALDKIIAGNTDGKLPQLSLIFAELQRQQSIARSESDLGWASFKIKDRDYVIRVKARSGTWIIHDCVLRDIHGVEHHVQQHVGDPVVERLPAEATDYLISPDNRARLRPEEEVSRDEIHEIVNQTLHTMRQR